MKCSICQTEVTADNYAEHVQTAHSSPQPAAPAMTRPEPAIMPANGSGGTIQGRTSSAPILSASFFAVPGVKLSGRVLSIFPTRNGKCYTLDLGAEHEFPGDMLNPSSEGVQKLSRVSIGEYKGMMQVLGSFDYRLKVGDRLSLESIGATNTGKDNDMILFEVGVVKA
jgi:hypothetical protein